MNDGNIFYYNSHPVTGRDKDLIGDALDFYVDCHGVFATYDEHMALQKEVRELKEKFGIL